MERVWIEIKTSAEKCSGKKGVLKQRCICGKSMKDTVK